MNIPPYWLLTDFFIIFIPIPKFIPIQIPFHHTFTVFIIKTPMICRGRPEASVIDSPTWVVRGSDSSVAAETNISRQAANQSPGGAWGFI